MDTRSKTCRRTKSGPCSRLSGHKGACRPTLTRGEARPAGVEVLSADVYTVQPDIRPKAEVVLDRTITVDGRTWNIVCLSDGTVTSTEVVESPAPVVEPRKARTSTRRPKVRTLSEAGPDGRDVQRIGHAKRAKAAPASTRSRSNAGALKGRISPKGN
jgi:hypothetical protein